MGSCYFGTFTDLDLGFRLSQSRIGTIPTREDLGGRSPPIVSTPFFPGRRHSSGSEARSKTSTPDILIVDTRGLAERPVRGRLQLLRLIAKVSSN